ncbi:transposase [Amycolatopsis sp. CA-230715]|uniref:transposase n=1 Tax=Amycolatopsis sp. CA-230715 TaxID=2745196 RepID=UPI001C02BE25|nr:transposase [Amycolatopsis sp. CA-230715]
MDTVNTDGTAADRSAMDLAAERLAEILADDETGRMLAAAAALPASDASAVIARIADAATARVLRERPGRPIRLSRTDRTALVGCARGLIRERIGETGGGAAFPRQQALPPELMEREIAAWRSRPLDIGYPVLHLATVAAAEGDDRTVRLAVAVDADGLEQVLGIWVGCDWRAALAELRERGLRNAFVVCCAEDEECRAAVEAVWPDGTVITSTAELITKTMRSVPRAERAAALAAIRPIFDAADEAQACRSMIGLRLDWDAVHPALVAAVEACWDRIAATFRFDRAVRRLVYSSNIVDQVEQRLRRPAEEITLRSVYLIATDRVRVPGGRDWPEVGHSLAE